MHMAIAYADANVITNFTLGTQGSSKKNLWKRTKEIICRYIYYQ